jgi:predicted AAA+ superfamily ATPase
MKKLPIGIQSFENLREDNYLYVDKTKDIQRLITSGKMYFLSRPRRFGKSLLISTLEALFLGKKILFDELFIIET